MKWCILIWHFLFMWHLEHVNINITVSACWFAAATAASTTCCMRTSSLNCQCFQVIPQFWTDLLKDPPPHIITSTLINAHSWAVNLISHTTCSHTAHILTVWAARRHTFTYGKWTGLWLEQCGNISSHPQEVKVTVWGAKKVTVMQPKGRLSYVYVSPRQTNRHRSGAWSSPRKVGQKCHINFPSWRVSADIPVWPGIQVAGSCGRTLKLGDKSWRTLRSIWRQLLRITQTFQDINVVKSCLSISGFFN